MDKKKDEFNHILDATAEQVAYNAQRMDQLLETLQDKLSRDYMAIPKVIGGLMVAGGFAHIWMRGEWAFSFTALICGALIISLALFFRTRIAHNLTVFGQALAEIDRDRNDHTRKLAVIRCLFDKGIPTGMSLHHLLILLGEHTGKEKRPTGSAPENN